MHDTRFLDHIIYVFATDYCIEAIEEAGNINQRYQVFKYQDLPPEHPGSDDYILHINGANKNISKYGEMAVGLHG
ncbi:hypothetical protein TNIN_218041 [Trichonephila inaurata madagascariensis]|uniref:Uncharacterized protein n=1 Tax=Trichonephila inaurata madagascariensis TaxID=2747483 RepID=A0A8X7CB05_9ARAC|nr:hypothetical protein TNIN_218041 [Trichonephila inaurata madagascariensis]